MLEKEPENALQPNMVTSTSVTSSTQMTSASEETTVQQGAEDGSGVKKTVTVQQETTQKVMTSTSEQVWVTLPGEHNLDGIATVAPFRVTCRLQ